MARSTEVRCIPVAPRRYAACGPVGLLSALLVWSACSGGGPGTREPAEPSDGGAEAPSGDGGSGDGRAPTLRDLVIEPQHPEHTVGIDALPPITFTASAVPADSPLPAVVWSSDSPELGRIDPRSGVFTPTGAAGQVTITATAGALSASTTLTLVVRASQEGDPDAGSTPTGAGGLGGVGGEGGGTRITDPALRDALDATPEVDPELTWLYPYDGTVWPRGLPAPLLQWRHGKNAPLAVRIHIEVDDSFRYDGYFGPPQALGAAAPIRRLPIPQSVWRNALYSGSQMRVSIVVAASDGAGGYRTLTPAQNPTWLIAPGSLKGTVYYNSYGSKLAQQLDALNGDRFGGATLAIRGDSFDPVLVAGTTTADESGCRVCHSVSGDGSVMIVQHVDNTVSSRYSLNNLSEYVYPEADNGKFGWSALSPDGSLALGNSGPPGDNPLNVTNLETSQLYRVSDGAVLTAQGLSSFVTRAVTPMFSVDGTKVVFNLYAGPGNDQIVANGKSLVVMDFRRINATTYAFENPVSVFTATEPDHMPGWPFFLPDGKGVIFQLELRAPANERLVTRNGSRGQLWWTDLEGNAHPLDRANGVGYLPKGSNGHDRDELLNFEPTVAPIVAGGYAWVVFTSRRMYGNVATRNPYDSDPRETDLSEGNPQGPTTKKLWMAAIDMPPKPGTDPSHPAFYLPAQELVAGNSRAFWVPDPCRDKGESCTSGDECCGGYCRANAQGEFVCADELPPNTCAQEYESCERDDDCCATSDNPLYCIGGYCAQLVIF
jgi:hypothetical protein